MDVSSETMLPNRSADSEENPAWVVVSAELLAGQSRWCRLRGSRRLGVLEQRQTFRAFGDVAFAALHEWYAAA